MVASSTESSKKSYKIFFEQLLFYFSLLNFANVWNCFKTYEYNKNFLKSDFCVCGNTLAKPNSNSSSICTHGCSGNQTEECGGYGNGNDYYSIYATVAGMWNVTFYLTY
jgi:hypothetical protein